MPDINGQHLLAGIITDGNITFAGAHDYAYMADPAVLAIRKRISAEGDATLTNPQRH
jgi:hypothetical protein